MTEPYVLDHQGIGIRVSVPEKVWDQMTEAEKEKMNNYAESNTGSYVSENGAVVYNMDVDVLAEYIYFTRIMRIKYNATV